MERVRARAPDGIDLAFDMAGQGGVEDLITLTGDPARVATIADFSAAALGVKVTGGGDSRATEALDEAAALAQTGGLQVVVAQTFTFAQAADAHRLSEGGHVRGKLVLVPSSRDVADGAGRDSNPDTRIMIQPPIGLTNLRFHAHRTHGRTQPAGRPPAHWGTDE